MHSWVQAGVFLHGQELTPEGSWSFPPSTTFPLGGGGVWLFHIHEGKNVAVQGNVAPAPVVRWRWQMASVRGLGSIRATACGGGGSLATLGSFVAQQC